MRPQATGGNLWENGEDGQAGVDRDVIGTRSGFWGAPPVWPEATRGSGPQLWPKRSSGIGSGSAGSNPAAQMLKERQSGAPPAHRSEAEVNAGIGRGRPGVSLCGVRSLGFWRLRLGGRGRGGCWERKTGPGELSGEGVVRLGPGRDQRSQRSVGGEDAVVTVAVDPGGRAVGGGDSRAERRSAVRPTGPGPGRM